jgi:hypothetical protein
MVTAWLLSFSASFLPSQPVGLTLKVGGGFCSSVLSTTWCLGSATIVLDCHIRYHTRFYKKSHVECEFNFELRSIHHFRSIQQQQRQLSRSFPYTPCACLIHCLNTYLLCARARVCARIVTYVLIHVRVCSAAFVLRLRFGPEPTGVSSKLLCSRALSDQPHTVNVPGPPSPPHRRIAPIPENELFAPPTHTAAGEPILGTSVPSLLAKQMRLMRVWIGTSHRPWV